MADRFDSSVHILLPTLTTSDTRRAGTDLPAENHVPHGGLVEPGDISQNVTGVLPPATMWDQRLTQKAMQGEVEKWKNMSPLERAIYRLSQDLWMLAHVCFPVVFLNYFVSAGVELLGRTYGTHHHHQENQAIGYLIGFLAAWLLDYIWETFEQGTYILSMANFPTINFLKGFGAETLFNSVVIDVFISGFLGLVTYSWLNYNAGYRPRVLVSYHSWEFYIQFVILWFALARSGKNRTSLWFWTVVDLFLIVGIQSWWNDVPLGYSLLWAGFVLWQAFWVSFRYGNTLTEPFFSYLAGMAILVTILTIWSIVLVVS